MREVGWVAEGRGGRGDGVEGGGGERVSHEC